MSVEEQNIAIARRYYDEIMNKASLSAIDELMAPDFLFTLATHPEPYHGPEGFKNLVTMLHGAFPDVHLAIQHLIAEGDTVLGHWQGSGTHTGAALHTVMGDIPPSGKGFVIDGMSWLRMKDGKITESLANEDTLGLLKQIGVLPGSVLPPVTSVAQNKAIIRRYFDEVLSAGNHAVIDELVHPYVTFHTPTVREPVRGIEGVKAFLKGSRTAFPDIVFVIEREIGQGDKVAVRWTIDATHRGPFLDIPPSGNKIHDQGADVFRLVDGKIIDIWVNENDLGLMQQLGALPTGAAIKSQ